MEEGRVELYKKIFMHISPMLGFYGIYKSVEDNGEPDLIDIKECKFTHFVLVFASRPVISCSICGSYHNYFDNNQGK